MIQCFISPDNQGEFNIALEDYLMHQKEDYFFLYINRPCIIIGKHQNALAETNFNFAQKNNIPIIRRISGGGTVYHDMGNLNYCFIVTENSTNKVNFKKYTQYLITALQPLGVKAKLKDKSNIVVEDKKISGNASHIFKNRVLHHGTLLVSSNLDWLSRTITPPQAIFYDQSVKSIRKETMNIQPLLNKTFLNNELAEFIFAEIKSQLPNPTDYSLTKTDKNKIQQIVKKKYANWQWNFGYSPKYTMSTRYLLKENTSVHSELYVENGIIKKCEVQGNFFSIAEKKILSEQFVSIPHNKKMILNRVSEIKEEALKNKMVSSSFVDRLFS